MLAFPMHLCFSSSSSCTVLLDGLVLAKRDVVDVLPRAVAEDGDDRRVVAERAGHVAVGERDVHGELFVPVFSGPPVRQPLFFVEAVLPKPQF